MRVVGCLHCEQDIAIEDYVPDRAKIQCPYCGAEAVVLEMGRSKLPVATVLEMPPEEVDEPIAVSGDYIPEFTNPAFPGDSESHLADPDAVGAFDAVDETGNAEGEPHSSAVAVDDSPHEMLATAPTDTEAAIESTFELAPAEETSNEAIGAATPEAQTATLPVRTSMPRRKKRGPNMLALMAQVILGGVIGIGGTIMGLLWLPGKWKRDPFNVGPEIGKIAPWAVPETYRTSANGATPTQNANAPSGKPKSNKKVSNELPENSDGPSMQPLPPGSFDEHLKKKLETSGANSDDPDNVTLDPSDSTTTPPEMEETFDDPSFDVKPSSGIKGSDDNSEKEMPAEDPAEEPTESPTVEPAETPDEPSSDPAPNEPSPENPAPVKPTEQEPSSSTEPAVPRVDASTGVARVTAAREAFNAVLKDPDSQKQQKVDAVQAYYAKLCGLADLPGNSAVEGLKLASGTAFDSQVISRSAAGALDNPESVSKPIVVAGKVTSSQTIGKLVEIKIDLFTPKPRSVTLVTAGENLPAVKTDDSIVAIGYVTQLSETPIEGYDGTGIVLANAKYGPVQIAE